MIKCDFFEDNFTTWKAGKLAPDETEAMERHASTCPYCAKLCAETVRLRTNLASLPRIEPSSTFEFRLQRRLSDVRLKARTANSGKKALIPRWSVISAGLVTGVIVGVLLIVPSNNEQDMIATNVETPLPMTPVPTADRVAVAEKAKRSVRMMKAEPLPKKMHIRGSRAGAPALQPLQAIEARPKDAMLMRDLSTEAVADVITIEKVEDDSTKDADSTEVNEIPYDPDRHAQKVSHTKE